MVSRNGRIEDNNYVDINSDGSILNTLSGETYTETHIDIVKPVVKIVSNSSNGNWTNKPFSLTLTGNDQNKKSLMRKIRKDFYKIKQELGLINYMFDDLRFSNLDN